MLGKATRHRFQFFRAGGVDQVQLKTADDLAGLAELDQKLWVALSCPVRGLEFDERTLRLLDSGNDGKVRASELLAAIAWCEKVLNDLSCLCVAEDALPLSAIDDDDEVGALLRSSAEAILSAVGKPEATFLTVADVSDALTAFSKELENGDGIVPPEAIRDEALAEAAKVLLALDPSPKLDRSGLPGLEKESLIATFEALRSHQAHQKEGLESENNPCGAETSSAFAALQTVQAKVADYFARASVLRFDERALGAMGRPETAFDSLGGELLSANAQELEAFPLAKVTGKADLPLTTGLNPAWRERLSNFREKVVTPILGERTTLSEAEFKTILEKFATHAAWNERRSKHKVTELSQEQLSSFVELGAEERLLSLIERDRAAEARASVLEDVEKLTRFQRDLLTLANNFVSFRDFYDPNKNAIFQIGTLFIDQREATLCFQVNDATKHATMAGLSRMYLLYCDLKGNDGKTMQIAAAITDGDVDNLMVGRNGVFYDRKGHDWDATVTRIVEAPISVRQAFWSPYKKLIRLIEEQVSKRAAAAQAEADQHVNVGAQSVDGAMKGDVKAPPAIPKKMDIGVVAALGVAVGGITAALGALLEAFFGLGIWMPLGLLGLLLLISGPSMAIAWLKLRQRNIGPILDANGWAVNVQAKINIPLGHSLTHVALLPKNATRDLVDPFAEKKRPMGLYLLQALIVLLGLCWLLGKLDRFLPERYQSTHILGTAAPSLIKPSAAPPAAPK